MRPGGPSRRRLVAAAGGRRSWWVTFGLLALLFSLWSLASPLFSVPDEGAHIVNAAAVVRGQIGGEDRVVRVPELYANADDGALHCYAFLIDQPAGCAPRLRGSSRPANAATQFDRYPPMPYLLLGLPSLLPPSVTAVRLMRLIGALACAALVASGLMSATSLGRGMTVAATLVAVTPMAAFLAGSVNTSGIEVAAGIALWPSLLALVRHGPAASTRLVTRTAVTASVLATSRPISPLWVALAGAVVALAAGWPAVRALAADPRVVRAAVAVAVVTAATVVWVVLRHSLVGINGAGQGHGLKSDLLTSSGRFTGLYREMIGQLGWLDTPPPALLLFAWTAALGGLGLLAVTAAARRGLLALAAVTVLTFAVPVVLEAARARTSGFPWQGRYTLPLAAGVPVLAGWLVDTGAPAVAALVRRAARALIWVACGGEVVAHVWSTRRYVTGFDGSVFYLFRSGWHPPVPAWVLLVAFVAVAAALGWWADLLVGVSPTSFPGAGRPRPGAVPGGARGGAPGDPGDRGRRPRWAERRPPPRLTAPPRW
ncbi:MAG: DUF2142 domain-containing protein [Acidimicrobiales bacterium]